MLRRALAEEQWLNVRRTSVVRLLAVVGFAALFVVLGEVRGQAPWRVPAWPMVGYLLAAVAIWIGSRSRTAAPILALAPVVIDMPLVFLLQRVQLGTGSSASGVAGFTVGLFALVMCIGSLTLRSAQLWLAAGVAAALEIALQREAGVAGGAQVASALVLGFTALLLGYTVHRTERLLVRTSRQEKLAALGQLAAAVGHDLRNPLAAVTNSVFVLKRRAAQGKLDLAGSAELLEIAERELAASQRIVSDILDFAAERPLELAPTPLGPLVDECVQLVRAPASVTVRVELAPDLPHPVLSRDRFRQVLVNLLQNAAEAVPIGRLGQVTLEATWPGDDLVVRVRDDGAGMDAATRARLLEPLYTTKKNGTGLGLAIVDGLVKQHGGTLEIESAVGAGSCFTVTIPQRQPTGVAVTPPAG